MTRTYRSTPGVAELETIAADIRAWVLAAGKHPGGGSSAVEAVTALCFSGAISLGTAAAAAAAAAADDDRLVHL